MTIRQPEPADRRLRTALRGVRSRWRAGAAMLGLGALAWAALALALLGCLVMYQTRFDPTVVETVRLAFYATVLVIGAWLVARPALRRRDALAVARYLEASSGDLDGLVVTAVEVDRAPDGGASGALATRLAERAARASDGAAHGASCLRNRERRRTERGALAAIGAGLAAGLLALAGPASVRHGLALLASAVPATAAASPFALRVQPGSLTVAFGADQWIGAEPRGFVPSVYTLYHRASGTERWVEARMAPAAGAPAAGAGGAEALLANIETEIEYYVEADGVRSPRHRVSVLPRPEVARIDLVYRYPARTGRTSDRIEDATTVEAVVGTLVEVHVHPDTPGATGLLRLDDARALDLRDDGAGALVAAFEVAADGQYRVELAIGEAPPAAATPDYAIVALADRDPTVALRRPGADAQVTSVEEVEIAVEAGDDVGVRSLELVVSVNGAEEQQIALAIPEGSAPRVVATHVLSLESQGVSPGDLVSYYARVRDADDASARTVASDIYFMEVRPFDRSFRNAGGGQRGGGGGASAAEGALAAQQRTLLVALYNLVRDRGAFEADVFEGRLRTISAAQARIRERVDAIVRRIGSRPMVASNPGYRRMADELPKASKSMLEVEARLGLDDPDGALPSARTALLHLQRADSAFKDVRVAQARQGGGGAAAGDLANLFRLEMDKMRSQYEDVRRARPSAQQPVDDAMRALRDIARRQQREAERARLRARRGGDRADSQAALAEELEALVRRLERLSRERPSPSLDASTREAREAARAMREASGGGGEQAARQAADRVRGAERALEGDAPGRIAAAVGNARETVRGLQEEQRAIARDLRERLGEDPPTPEALEPLADRKYKMAERAAALAGELTRLSEQARGDRVDTAEALREAAGGLRDDGVVERLLRERALIARDPERAARDGEPDVDRALTALDRRLANAERGIARSPRDGVARALERTRGAMRALDATRGAGTGTTGGGGLDADGFGGAVDPTALRESMRREARSLAEVAPDLRAHTANADALTALVQALDALGEDSDDTFEQRLRELAPFERLQALERSLRESLDEPAATPLAAGPDDPAPAHRLQVERYFRNLSERSTP